MRRRELIFAVGSAIAFPLVAYAQQKQFTTGYLGNASLEDAPDWFLGFRDGLRENGFTIGENVRIEYRATKGQFNRFAEYANDLVRSGVDVIFAVDNAGALAAKAATPTIPIVFAIGGDPVALGLVASINRAWRQHHRGKLSLHNRHGETSGTLARSCAKRIHYRSAY
jgi:ABC-type uncharacterized transport system substrate-binding protein